MRRLVPLALLALVACAPEKSTARRVEPSAPDSPLKRVVSFNQPSAATLIGPACQEIRAGFTIEFRNYAPETSLMLNSLSGPETIYSPNIVEPYNFVPETSESGEYSFWRRVFKTPGVYEFYDASSTGSGTPSGGSYYGPAAFSTGGSSAIEGTICVTDPACVRKTECDDPSKSATLTREDCCDCRFICCQQDSDCGDDGDKECQGASSGQGRCVRKAQ